MNNAFANISQLTLTVLFSLIIGCLFTQNAQAQPSFGKKPLILKKGTSINPKIFGPTVQAETYKPEVTNRNVRQATLQLPFSHRPVTLDVEVIDGLFGLRVYSSRNI